MPEKSRNAAFARLRRALAHAGEDVLISELAERAVNIILEDMPLEAAGLLESILDNLARAAEELGPAATVPEIAARARELGRRPN
jgi:hypothetical protein